MLIKVILLFFVSNSICLSAGINKFSIFNQNHKLTETEQKKLYTTPCINGLVDKYLGDSEQILGATVVISIMLNSTYDQKYYLEGLNANNELTYMIKRADTYHYSIARVIEKAQMYLIFLSDANEIATHIELLKILPTYNPRAKIIACFLFDMTVEQFEQQTKKAITELYQMDFFDIFVFGLRPNSSILQSYTMFPYDNGNCARKVNDIVLVDECELLVNQEYKPFTVNEALEWSQNHNGIKYVEYRKFYPKLPDEIPNCEISVTGSAFEPYVVLSKRGHRIKKGLEVELLNATFQEMDAKAKFHLQDPKLRYNKRSLSNVTSVYKDILNKESPFLIGGFMRTPIMKQSIHVSNPYAYDDVTWCVHTAELAPTWLNTFKTYSWQLWIAVGVSLIACGLVLYLFIRYEQESRHQNLTWSYLNIFGTLISMFTVNYFPNQIFIRIFMASLLFAGINLWAAYTSSLISFLTKPRFDKQIMSVPEAVAAGYVFYGNVNYLDFIKENKMNQEGYAEVVKRYELCESIEQCFDKFLKNKKSAIASSRIQALYNSQSITISKFCFDTDENIYEYSVVTPCYPYHHLLPQLNDMIGRALQSGLIVKWMNDVQAEKQKEFTQTEIKLSIHNLEGVFVMLGIGTLFSIVGFIVEWTYFTNKNGRDVTLEKIRIMKMH